MGRQPCCEKVGLKRGPWTIEEDRKLINFILSNGIHCWRLVPKLAGLLRCGKSCRLRWTNYLRPDLKRGAFSEAEEQQIIELHSHLSNRWSKIASHFPGCTDNEIKNHWNTRIKKKLKLLGDIDPSTDYKPIQQADLKSHELVLMSNTTEDTESKNQDSGLLMEEEKGNASKGANNNANGNAEEMKLLHDENSSSSSIASSFSVNYDSTRNNLLDAKSSNLCWAEIYDLFPSWETMCHFDDVLSFLNYP